LVASRFTALEVPLIKTNSWANLLPPILLRIPFNSVLVGLNLSVILTDETNLAKAVLELRYSNCSVVLFL
jgi:hypothetical protein